MPVTAATRGEIEAPQLEILRCHGVELVVLARYMQILSADFVAHFPAAIVNVHHSFLPAFTGARPYRAAHARGMKLIGATSHYVTEVLDDGPIIEQDVARISHRDQVEDLLAPGARPEAAGPVARGALAPRPAHPLLWKQDGGLRLAGALADRMIGYCRRVFALTSVSGEDIDGWRQDF